MFTIMQSDVIRTQVYVPQDAAFGVTPGVDAVVRVPELPDRTFPGKVTRIADALQPGTRTLLTEIDIPNPDGALKPGIYCTVELQFRITHRSFGPRRGDHLQSQRPAGRRGQQRQGGDPQGESEFAKSWARGWKWTAV